MKLKKGDKVIVTFEGTVKDSYKTVQGRPFVKIVIENMANRFRFFDSAIDRHVRKIKK